MVMKKSYIWISISVYWLYMKKNCTHCHSLVWMCRKVDISRSLYYTMCCTCSSSWLTLKSIPWNMMYTQSSASILSTEFYTKMGLVFYKESHLMAHYLHRHYILLSGPFDCTFCFVFVNSMIIREYEPILFMSLFHFS